MLAFQFKQRPPTRRHQERPAAQRDRLRQSCGQCVNACPCGALDYGRERRQVFRAINDPTKIVVGFVAPAVRSVIAAQFGSRRDEASPFMAGLMRAIGFDKVFDFSFAADLTIMEETTEFLNRVEQQAASCRSSPPAAPAGSTSSRGATRS